MARSRPSSRVRWATRIVKVLKMMKAPTTTPMAAKPSSASVKKPRNCRTGWPTSTVASDAVCTSYSGPSVVSMRACSSAVLTSASRCT